MIDLINNPWFIEITSSIVGAGIFALIGKRRGWWWKTKKRESVALATRVFKCLDDEAVEETNQLVELTFNLGSSLIASYRTKIAHDEETENSSLSLVTELLSLISPLVTELSAADKELDDLKRAIIEFQKSLKRREQIVRHLCHPPNPPAMDARHVQAQLLDEVSLPYELLVAAKGEAIIFLRGHGIGWLERQKKYHHIRGKQWKLCSESIQKEYRKILQLAAIGKSRN